MEALQRVFGLWAQRKDIDENWLDESRNRWVSNWNNSETS
jgi:hypothetical protein